MAKPNVISKADLIHFAKQCLVDNGMEKFTLRAVAEKAGVTQGTVYYHFRTKEQLLLDMVADICETSWDELSQSNEFIIKQALDSAKSRCSYDSFFHQLLITLTAASFHHEKIRTQLGQIIAAENAALVQHLSKLWPDSPIEGVSFETWGVFFNAIIDGLALQALLQKDFPVDKIYGELEQLFIGLSRSLKEAE